MNAIASGCSFSQHMVNQGPKYDNQVRKKKKRPMSNQVVGKSGLLRPDLRRKVKYL